MGTPDKTCIEKDTSTPMFIAALVTVAKTRKQLKCPSTDEGSKMWCIYTVEYYSAIKKHKIVPVAATMEELETLSEVSQKEKDKYHMISLIPGIQYRVQMNLSTEKKLMDLENRLVVAKGEGVGWTGNLGLINANYCLWNG